MLPIFLVVLVDVFALTLVIPLLAIYAEQLGATPLQATLLVSVFAACSLLSAPVLGQLSDRYGRKRLLLVSQAGTLAGLVLMANAHSLWVLYLARILDGLTAGNLSLAQAWISDHTPPEKRTRSFALIGIAFGGGFTLGPLIAYFGLVVTTLVRVLTHPRRLRLTSLVYHMDHTGLRCLPILGFAITMTSFPEPPFVS
jgi:MFS family permease